MVDVAEQHAALDPMEDQANVSAGAGRPELLVLVDLEFIGGEFGRFLLLTVELVQAGLEAVSGEAGMGIRRSFCGQMSRSPYGVRLICTRSVESRNSAGIRMA